MPSCCSLHFGAAASVVSALAAWYGSWRVLIGSRLHQRVEQIPSLPWSCRRRAVDFGHSQLEDATRRNRPVQRTLPWF